ncbi:Uncharacterised protein [Mycobacteroides abscessus subsp. abscessus]|nr:Uncharacterised protein [Mycobacteroides abscessus subsp. abscessus]
MLGAPQQLDDHSRCARVGGVLGQLVDHFEDCRHWCAAVDVLRDQRLHDGQIAFEDRPEHRRLVGEVVEDTRRADTGRPGDVRHARPLIPPRSEQPGGLDDDLLALARYPLRVDSPHRYHLQSLTDQSDRDYQMPDRTPPGVLTSAASPTERQRMRGGPSPGGDRRPQTGSRTVRAPVRARRDRLARRHGRPRLRCRPASSSARPITRATPRSDRGWPARRARAITVVTRPELLLKRTCANRVAY